MAPKENYAPYYWKHNKLADKFYNSGLAFASALLSFVIVFCGTIMTIVELVSNGISSLPVIVGLVVFATIITSLFLAYYADSDKFNKGDELIHNQYKSLDNSTKKKLRPLAKAYGQGKMNGDENRKFAILVQEKFKLVKDSSAQNKYLSALDMELATVEQEKEVIRITKEAQKDIDKIMKEFR